jgi:N-acetylglucosaminyl-diphospho-decaprenol L-rhamnosyltransferase
MGRRSFGWGLLEARYARGARVRRDYHRAAVSAPTPVRLSVVIVTFNSREAVARSVPALCAQLGAGDELVVVDNGSTDGTPDAVAELAPRATVVRNRANEGFAAGCNAGVAACSGDLVVLLNPDALPAPGFCDAIRRPLAEDRGWCAWMGLVTMDGGRLVNSSGGVVHLTGISWAGEAGRPVSEVGALPREVGFVSGACLALPRETWLREGGFPPEFFMYHEDVDLSLRLRLAGGRLCCEPAARLEHAYEFAKGQAKWRLLERNRWATVIRTYPGPLLTLVAPALLATELAVAASALADGWGRQKLLAWADTVRALPRLLRERRHIQARRRIGAREFAASLTPELSSPYLGWAAASRPLDAAMRAYWALVLALLGGRPRALS